jgi:hypothetical protein
VGEESVGTIVVHEDSFHGVYRRGGIDGVCLDVLLGCRRGSGANDGLRVVAVDADGSRPGPGASHGARCDDVCEGGCHGNAFAGARSARGSCAKTDVEAYPKVKGEL